MTFLPVTYVPVFCFEKILQLLNAAYALRLTERQLVSRRGAKLPGLRAIRNPGCGRVGPNLS